MALDDTAKGINSNTYISQADADAYFDDRLYVTDWTGATDAVKEDALIWSTKILDQRIDWVGSKTTEEQALRWPRAGVIDMDGYSIDEDTNPQFLKDALCELALLLIQSNRMADDDTAGFKSISVGSIKLEIDKFDRIEAIPDLVYQITQFYGDRISTSGDRTVKLIRT